MIGIPIRGGNLDTGKYTQEDHHVKMEAEIGAMCLQAIECQGL